jgi:LuxR family transcriptional regulator, maltose regulon positive regulatory protein
MMILMIETVWMSNNLGYNRFMAPSILVTKLFIPQPHPELVSRPRLIEQLNRGLHSKLTLISAPAGFGKTTLVSDWIANIQLDGKKRSQSVNRTSGNKNRVAWLSLDEGDNDLNSFLIYFIAAMQTVEPDIGLEPLAALQSSGAANSEAVLMAFLNEIASLTQPLVLILDDYHLIENQSIDKALTFLLDHLPATLHLVITTRIDPALPLARLRGRGQLTELRVAELRFTHDEATMFLNQMMRLELSAENIVALGSRTEGWITGLQLAALSLQERDAEHVTSFIQSFTGIHHHILDYLVEEVLQQQPPRLHSFLLQTSILTRLTGSLCEAVCDFENDSSNQSDGHTILQQLAKSNLFIVPLDDERRWYRYHHLFADLLRYRLQREPANTIPELHRRASKWHEEHGFIDRAIRHAITADDLEQAARLVDEHSHPANERGEVSIVRGWFELLPDEMVRSDPSLSVACAWNLFLNGQISAVEDRLQDAETLLAKQTTSISNEQVAELFGKITALRAILFGFQGKPVRGIELAQQLLEHIAEDNLSARGITLLTLGGLFRDVGDIPQASRSFAEAVTVLLASENILAGVMAVEQLVRLLVMQGQLVQVAEICQEMLNLSAGTKTQGKLQALISDMAQAIFSTVLYERNELADAELYVRQGIKQAKRGGFFQSLVFGQILLTRILQARGDADGANKRLQAAMKSTQMNSSQRYHAELTACQVQLWLAQNDLDTASQWAQESNLSTEVEFNPQNEFEHISLARVLIAQGRAESDEKTLAKALELTKRLALSAESAGRRGHLIELLILQALALDAQGDLNQALSSLERALGLAAPQGFVRIFLDKGAPIIRLLKEAARRDIAADYVIKLLNRIDTDTRPDVPNQSPATLLVDPLSDRELEVLHLMAQDLSYKEIADQIMVSLNTVRTHVKNIYSKLMVHKRSQAVAKARELNIL